MSFHHSKSPTLGSDSGQETGAVLGRLVSAGGRWWVMTFKYEDGREVHPDQIRGRPQGQLCYREVRSSDIESGTVPTLLTLASSSQPKKSQTAS